VRGYISSVMQNRGSSGNISGDAPAASKRQYHDACALMASGHFDQAAAAWQLYLSAHPNDASALCQYGYIQFRLGRAEQALATLRHATACAPGSAEACACLGNLLAAMNRPEEAVACHADAVRLDPSAPAPRTNLGMTLLRLGRADEAIAHLEAASALAPDTPNILAGLGSAYARTGYRDKALACFTRVAALLPDSAAAQINCAVMAATAGRYNDAETMLRRAITLDGDNASAHANLGNVLNATKRPDEALAAFDRALRIDPRFAPALYGRGQALGYLGHSAEARAALEQALAIAPAMTAAHYALTEFKVYSTGDPQIAELERLQAKTSALSPNEQAELHFSLFRVHADLGRHDDAFTHLMQGNTCKRRTIAYDEAAMLAAITDMAQHFPAERIRALAGRGDPSDVAVFIIGLPRSGSTLVEQILASHPGVYGAGEITAFGDLAGGYDADPFDPALLNADAVAGLGRQYLANVVPQAPKAAHIVDKQLLNFRYAGLIHLALPRAKIIHIRRDPLDTLFSCYSHIFRGALNYTYDLGELGRYYLAYNALMAHWRAVLPATAIIEVDYETLVGHFEDEVRRIIDFCGLPWDAHCLQFHETVRPVHTASAAQVRRPLFRGGIGRWRPYATQLVPLREIIGA
jgi:tetratricopeptide (TPR) repeat protein